jgi:GrpB-like predicted nucleotidyltransferase (UPF0157 family)
VPIGLLRHTVRLVQHEPVWELLFATEAAAIRSCLGDIGVDVQHVGSTAVPGLAAKPILDIAVAVNAPEAVALSATLLSGIGYLDRGSAGRNGGHLLVREAEADVRTTHVHIVHVEDPQWEDYLWFRNSLRTDERMRHTYSELKTRLAEAHDTDRRAYTAGKDLFIRSVLAGRPRST